MSDAPDSAQSATKRKARGKSQAGKPRQQDTTAGTLAPVLDDETAAALTLYNTYLVADREQQAHERALKKAEKAKDDAAAAVRKLNDRKAPAAETAEAEARYREAAETLQRLRGGNTAAPDADDDNTKDDNTDDDTEDDAAKSGAEDAEDADDDKDTASEQSEDTADEQAEESQSAAPEDTASDNTEDTDSDNTEDTDSDNTEDTDSDNTEDTDSDNTEDTDSDTADEVSSVGVEASVGDEDLAGDEPAGVAG